MFLGFSLFQVTHWMTAAGLSLVRYMKRIWKVKHHTNPIREQVFFLIIDIIRQPKSKWKMHQYTFIRLPLYTTIILGG